MQKYSQYINLSSKLKAKKIQEANQSEAFRKPNPQGYCQFHEFNFLQFYVLEDKKKIKLHTYRHNPKQEPIGVIFMFHGLNSHIGHGAHLADYFALNGFVTVGFDHRGFGRSEGQAGFTQSLEAHLYDCKEFIKLVSPQYENLPKFALGLSMGGMTSYHLSLENPNLFDGVILMAPALKNQIGGFLINLTGALSSVLPKKSKLTKPVYGKASKNPAITEFVKNDKYAFSERVSLSTINLLVSTMDKSPSTFKNYKCPFIIFQGGLDKLVNPEVAFQLYENSKTKPEDKQIHFYEEMWHDIWHEQQIYEIMERTVSWMTKRIKKENDKKGQ